MKKIITETGSVYENDGDRVRRVGKHKLRRDGEWLQLLEPVHVKVGHSVKMVLEPLGDGVATIRTTSKVVEIIEEKEIQ